MNGLEPEEVGSWARSGGGAFSLPTDCGSVVGKVVAGFFPGVGCLAKNVLLADGSREFDVAVGDGACRVAPAHKGVANSLAERVPPEKGGDSPLVVRDKDDSSHAGSRSVASTQRVGNHAGNDFGDSGGASLKVLGQPAKIVQKVVDVLVKPDPVLVVFVPEGFLQRAEQPASPRNGRDHGAELSQDLVPLLDGDAALIGVDAAEDFVEAGDAVRGQFDGAQDRVDDPPKDDFAGGPRCVSFEHLFD